MKANAPHTAVPNTVNTPNRPRLTSAIWEAASKVWGTSWEGWRESSHWGLVEDRYTHLVLAPCQLCKLKQR